MPQTNTAMDVFITPFCGHSRAGTRTRARTYCQAVPDNRASLYSLDDMAVFAAVAREASFTSAGRALGMTKQSVSERVARLEARLGVQLMIRSTRRLHMTDIGAEYARACTAIVAHADSANLIAHQAQHRPTGLLRVTCPVGLSRPLVMPTIEEYRRIHPGVDFEVAIEERVLDLIKEGIDLGIRVGTDSSSPSYMTRPLFENEAVFVASRELVERHGEPRTAADVRRLPRIVRRNEQAWTVHGESIPIAGALVVNTVFGVADAAIAGLGIAAVPQLIVRDEIASGKLRVLFGHPARQMRFFAVWPARRLSVKVRTFLELLTHKARELTAG
jgi:DNA-binding transcriptional LysR family regulator